MTGPARRALAGSFLVLLLTTGSFVTAQDEAADCGGARLLEVAAEVGIGFVHDRGVTGLMHLPETMGAGLAWLDYDGDGWQDLYLVQSGPFPSGPVDGPTNRLLRNVDGRRFVDVTARAAAGDSGYGQGATAVDLDGDGAVDLVVTNFGPDVLLWNEGDGTFRRDDGMLNERESNWSSSAAAGDADGDGDLDLYVSRYIDYDAVDPPFCGDPETGKRRYCDPSIFVGLLDRFYVNQGERNLVESAAGAGFSSANGRGLGLAFVDFDGDLLPDLYVANDLDPNHLFHNRGDGTFDDVSLLSGGAVNRSGKPEAGMGVAVADLDGDLRPELFVTNFDVETNTHYRNMGDLSFSDVSTGSGYGPPSFNMLAFGLGIADFDADGHWDVFLGNGHIFEQPRRDNTEFRQPDQLLLGDGAGRLREVRCELLLGRRTVTRGVALADYDNDGDADVGLQENGGPAALLRSDTAGRRWVGARLVGTGGGSEGVGARVELVTGQRTLVRWVQAGDSYQSSSDRRVLFPLAPGEEPTAVTVVWPSGQRLRLDRPLINRYLTLPQP